MNTAIEQPSQQRARRVVLVVFVFLAALAFNCLLALPDTASLFAQLRGVPPLHPDTMSYVLAACVITFWMLPFVMAASSPSSGITGFAFSAVGAFFLPGVLALVSIVVVGQAAADVLARWH
ncbi:hypothetical protein H8A99_28700 [Bradyrhizobium sp. Arg68]|uniref:hypothetical protein n=1 Tax=Bradyrhizobium ivorense TaxID=2511166 RepID=UPI001E5810F8|nr:hypothetical protein [Bradyrhizobium ivorense]MCC8940331.1 hypothetical protein [Bradyrhizobium ivorense]